MLLFGVGKIYLLKHRLLQFGSGGTLAHTHTHTQFDNGVSIVTYTHNTLFIFFSFLFCWLLLLDWSRSFYVPGPYAHTHHQVYILQPLAHTHTRWCALYRFDFLFPCSVRFTAESLPRRRASCFRRMLACIAGCVCASLFISFTRISATDVEYYSTVLLVRHSTYAFV